MLSIQIRRIPFVVSVFVVLLVTLLLCLALLHSSGAMRLGTGPAIDPNGHPLACGASIDPDGCKNRLALGPIIDPNG